MNSSCLVQTLKGKISRADVWKKDTMTHELRDTDLIKKGKRVPAKELLVLMIASGGSSLSNRS